MDTVEGTLGVKDLHQGLISDLSVDQVLALLEPTEYLH
jgi:hypothetical protein